MAVTGVNYSGNASSSSNNSSTTKTSQDLGKDDFLNLLVTQLKYQDPLSPMEDKEFISQMAQFTSLEQMKNMNNSVQITQATSFIGKQVTWADSQGNEVKGVVKSVKIVNGEARVIVGNETLELKQILSVSEVATNPVA
jgi:flagellar basal-body rod modification protein FlgD